MIPANDMMRYKNLPIGEAVRSKIFGKTKEHSIETYLDASKITYP